MNKHMLITSSTWEEKYKSFKMIPMSQDCPYVEAFFDPTAQLLVIVGANKKEQFTLLQKLNEFGYPLIRQNKTVVDRHRITTYKEYYINEPDEIRDFVNLFGFNSDTFNFDQYLKGTLISTSPKVIHADVPAGDGNVDSNEVLKPKEQTADLS